MPAMVVALKLQKLRASGHSSGQSDSGHHGFGSGIREANALGVRDDLLNHLRDFQFDWSSSREVGAARRRFCDRFDDFRMRMAKW